MRTRKVRVRRQVPAGRIVLLLSAALAAFLYISLLRGDPVEAILNARDAERIRTEVVLPALALHAVRTATCDSEEAARVEAARYVPRGAAGFVLHRETWHVLAAGYESEEEAIRVRDHLREVENIPCDTVSLVCGSVTVRVTATAGQTDALVTCERTLRETVTLIGALSYAVDRGDASVSHAVGSLKKQCEALRKACVLFEAGAGESPDSAVCRPLAAICEEAARKIDILTEDASALTTVQFSGRMKAIFLQLRISQIEFLAALGG